MKTTTLNWQDIERCCVEICKKIKGSNIRIDAIVSVQRGGGIPSVIMSHLLEISDFYTIGIRTTSSENIRAKRFDMPIMHVPDALKNIENMSVLIIDDVTNTGNTLSYAKREIEKYHPKNCITAALIWDGDNSSACMADFYADYSPCWVVFPWEDVIM